jgi:hypothetical protein
LGERKVRLTKVALQDLQDMAKIPALVPYIRTITFGNACLVSDDSRNKRLLEFVEDTEVRERLYDSYVDASNWPGLTKVLEYFQDALKVFPNLQALRVIDKTKLLAKKPYDG